MLIYELEKLIKSLSAPEKKRFTAYCKQQGRTKDYVALYELAVTGKEMTLSDWERQFKAAFPTKSFDNTATYLYKVLTDILVQIRIEQDAWYQQYQSLMKARLCFERSIPDRAFRELRKASRLAGDGQNHMVHYQAARMELTALADMGFPGLTEQDLVDWQMKAKHTLQMIRQIQEHYSLYELLSHRLTQGKNTKSGKQDKQVNDLILSELSLTTRGSQHQFEPQKLHLLFQSFFFIHTGEYRSAMHIFNQLTHLIEANEVMWDFPPYDYLSALDGILDSLRSIGFYTEMESFIHKLISLADRAYPEHFRNLASLTAHVYTLNMHVGRRDTGAALQQLQTLIDGTSRYRVIEGHEKQFEDLFFQGLTYFLSQQWSRARKCLNLLFSSSKADSDLPVFRAARLLHILISYETDDMALLEYEIRSYKRTSGKQGKTLQIEKLVFSIINADAKRRGNKWKADMRKKTSRKLEEIRADKREVQLMKYFDFGEWVTDQYR